MISTAKITNINKPKIIKLYNNSALEDYLKNYDIANELFLGSLICTKQDKVILKRYYDSMRERAETLVTDDEYVGITFENLSIISNLLNESRLVMKR